ARAEAALSQSMARWIGDLRRAPPGAETAFTDPGLRPPPTATRAVLEEAAAAPSLGRYLATAHAMNPIYAGLREALGRHRGRRGLERLIRINLGRARPLPADLGRRFVWVNAPAQRLWLYEDGRVMGTMKVVVGKAREPTPAMAAVVRYAVLNPYWNMPPDLAR